MTVLTVIQSVAAKVGIDPVPTSVFSSASRTAIELRETANECAAQIVQANDWNALTKLATITGDGVTTEYPLSTTIPDFGRIAKTGDLWSSNNAVGSFYHIADANEWLQQESYPIGWSGGQWTVFGGSLYIRSGQNVGFASGETVRFAYISKNYASSESNVLKAEFSADSDRFVLDERLLKLCMIWNWKSAHNQPYAQEFDEFQEAMEKLRLADRTPSIITSNSPYRWPGPAGFV